MDGEQVWALANNGVLHWDGQRWQLYGEAVTAPGASIVGGGGQVWVMDRGGTLFHFQGGQWQSQIWKDHPSAGKPKLARTANQALWLAWQGLWRFDGAKWVAITGSPDLLKDAGLIGAAEDRLWFSDRSGLRSLSMDGKGQLRLDPMGDSGSSVCLRSVLSGPSWFISHSLFRLPSWLRSCGSSAGFGGGGFSNISW